MFSRNLIKLIYQINNNNNRNLNINNIDPDYYDNHKNFACYINNKDDHINISIAGQFDDNVKNIFVILTIIVTESIIVKNHNCNKRKLYYLNDSFYEQVNFKGGGGGGNTHYNNDIDDTNDDDYIEDDYDDDGYGYVTYKYYVYRYYDDEVIYNIIIKRQNTIIDPSIINKIIEKYNKLSIIDNNLKNIYIDNYYDYNNNCFVSSDFATNNPTTNTNTATSYNSIIIDTDTDTTAATASSASTTTKTITEPTILAATSESVISFEHCRLSNCNYNNRYILKLLINTIFNIIIIAVIVSINIFAPSQKIQYYKIFSINNLITYHNHINNKNYNIMKIINNKKFLNNNYLQIVWIIKSKLSD